MLKLRVAWMGAIALCACEGAPMDNHDDRLKTIEARLEKLEKGRAVANRRPQRPDPKTVYAVSVYEDDNFRGSKHAKVTIVEAREFACPYCAQLEPVLTKVVDGYREGEVKLVSKQFVVHPNIATLPALAVCAANAQSKYAEYSDALWSAAWSKNGGRLAIQRQALEKAQLVELAKSVGLDAARFSADLDSAACKKKLNRDRQEMARLGVRGTPSLYINGRPYVGPRTEEGFRSALNAEIAKADRALARGGSLEGYYKSLIQKGKRTL